MAIPERVDDPAFFLPPEPPSFIERVSECLSDIEPPSWLINSMIERGSVGTIFGDWNVGKSAIAVDIACRVATGYSFAGRETRKGAVLYVAQEGRRGLQRRFKAWEAINKPRLAVEHSLYQCLSPVRLPDTEVEAHLRESVDFIFEQHGCLELVVIDTVSATMAGDQKHGADMSEYLAVLSRVFQDTTVMLIHHPGHADKSRARGASELPAACDWEFRLEKVKGGEDIVRLRNTKQRDSAIQQDLYFQLGVQPVGLDESGNPFGSVIVEHLANHKVSSKQKPPSRSERRMLEVLENIKLKRESRSTTDGVKVSEKEWIDGCVAESIKPDTARRLKSRMVDSGYLTIQDGYVAARDSGQPDNP